MQLECPHCHAVLEFAERRPSFCGYCGQSLSTTPAAPQAGADIADRPRSPGSSPTVDFDPEAATLAPPTEAPVESVSFADPDAIEMSLRLNVTGEVDTSRLTESLPAYEAAGVMNIDKIYLDVGRNFGANRWQFFKTIAVPGAMPAIFTGFQLSLGVALIVIVATEFVGAKTGIGYLIWQSWQTFSVDTSAMPIWALPFLPIRSVIGMFSWLR